MFRAEHTFGESIYPTMEYLCWSPFTKRGCPTHSDSAHGVDSSRGGSSSNSPVGR